jgi:EAL domain-containing protein (putative c-di-GMP-specific phosphodiesterase class I)
VELGDRIFQVSISAGVTFFPQTEETDADQLLRQADQAMYQAKLEGRNRYHIFDPALDRSVRDRHESLERIRLALAANEFVLFYQPKVNMCTGSVLGAEALIRWLHPERGLLPPSEFLPVIEGHPIAVEIGKWVIESALIQMEKWRAEGIDVPVSVNIGADQLQQAEFVDVLSSLMAAHPTIAPHMLELELLESSAFRDMASTSEVIRACKRLGVSSALDDFGTGYASLTYLKRLPVDVLKIDQTFVRDMLEDPEDMAILEGMLALASAFRCQAVAEGVETVEHGLMLLRLGCQVAQGYGIARPMQARDFPAWASTWHPDPRWKNVLPFHLSNRPVLYAGVEHRAWIVAIEDFLNGKRHSAPALGLNQCRFGTWLRNEALIDGVVVPGRGGLLGFQCIDALHQKIHALAVEVLSLSGDGRKAEAMGRIAELHELRDDLLDKLNNLLQP